MWVPVHDEEWDGDIPLSSDPPVDNGQALEEGYATFKGGALPWVVGRYEVSFHNLY